MKARDGHCGLDPMDDEFRRPAPKSAPRRAAWVRRAPGRCFFWALTVLACLGAKAQPQHVSFERIGRDQGLPGINISAIFQDRRGFLWFGTMSGLFRYDGYEFKPYMREPDNPRSLADNWVTALYEDSRGIMWVGTLGGGLHRFHRDSGDFTVYSHEPNTEGALSDNGVGAFIEDRDGILWIAVKSGGLDRFDPVSGKARHLQVISGSEEEEDQVRCMLPADNGLIWLGAKSGLMLFDPQIGVVASYRHIPTEPNSLSHNWVQALCKDSDGGLWAATFGGGLNRFDPETQAFRRYRHDPGNSLSLSHDEILSLLVDHRGTLWVGTEKSGLNQFDPKTERFVRHEYDSDRSDTLSNDRIGALFEDASGILWIGTRGGGVSKLDLHSTRFPHYKNEDDKPESLGDNWVTAISETEDGSLWLGTVKGLDRLPPDQGRFRHYRHDPENPESLSSDQIQSLAAGSGGKLWVGTLGGGLNRLDVDSGRVEIFRDGEDGEAPGAQRVLSVMEDSQGQAWAGFDGAGLSRLDPETGRFQHFRHDPKDPNSLGNDVVLSLLEDRDGAIWAGTLRGGLNRLDRETGSFRRFISEPGGLSHNTIISLEQTEDDYIWTGTYDGLCRFQPSTGKAVCWRQKDGLAGDVVNSALVDGRGIVWAATNMGLSRLDPASGQIVNFFAQDGLQSNEFSSNAGFRRRDGSLAFGGPNGFNMFRPTEVDGQACVYDPPVLITGFQIFNKDVPIATEAEDSPLTVSIEESESVRLSYLHQVFSFEFATLDFANPEKNRYAYMLDGFDEDWIETDASKRFITYTKQDPGSYVFRVRGLGKDGEWLEEEASLRIFIAPPWWKTWWAYTLYAALVLGLLAAYNRAQKRKLEVERAVNERLKQVDKLKDEFLANTSHELRTPLNGIIGLAESLTDGVAGPLSPKAHDDLSMIVSSGKRLTSLVNDLLDFSKLKNHSLELRRKAVDLRALVDVALTLSKPLVGRKDLALINATPSSLPPLNADENRLEQVLHNLIGNAVKFSEEGRITVGASIREEAPNMVEIYVADTGIGIEPDKLERIFESFEQGDASTARVYGGTGLGLAVTRQLIELHGGSIWAESIFGEGAIFRFTLPIYLGERETAQPPAATRPNARPRRAMQAARETSVQEAVPAAASASEPASEVAAGAGNWRILIVDDEPVNRQVLVNLLALRRCELTEASSGHEALWEIERHPGRYDLILLDVMMPRMSGLEVCRKIRQTYSVHELPIIFLTAKNQVGDLVEAFAAGANDYLAKPIEKGELFSRVDLHLGLLELNRNLERKVSERTQELNEKNRILDSKYQELERLNRIVQAINREVELKNVIKTLLDQGLALFSKAERGFFLIYDPSGRRFHCVAAAGCPFSAVADLDFDEDELLARCAVEGEPKESGVYIASHYKSRPDAASLAEALPAPESLIAMTIPLNGELAAMVFLENLSDPEAFQTSDVNKLSRFREHAVSAVAKAKMLKDLVETQRKLVEAAHTAGMAEIAASVLHNMGNTLNSVKVSAHVIHENAVEDKTLGLLHKLVDLMSVHEADLATFLTQDPRGRKAPGALRRVLSRLRAQRKKFEREGQRLIEQVDSMTAVLQEQQSHADGRENLVELLDLNEVAHEALRMDAFLMSERKITVLRDLGELPAVKVQKPKVLRVLFCLLKNAWESLAEMQDNHPGVIQVTTRIRDGGVALELTDNGVGIAPDHLSQVFIHGFTTKANNRGFGLHYCANAMKEMSGTIHIASEGVGHGATVALWFPEALKTPEEPERVGELVEELKALSELAVQKN